MSTTVTYKGSTLTTAENQTRTLETAGKYLEGNIIITDVTQGSTPTLQTKTKTYTPTESAQTESVSADVGYDGLDTVNVTVNAISSTYVGSGITRRSSSDLTASGATVSVPSGYYANNASKAVESGSIASASWSFNKTATRLEVNYSEDVTGGYIPTQTKTGKYEMVLEDKTVTPSTTSQIVTPTSNSRYLNSVTVEAMPSGTEGIPTATKGTVSNHAISVTPSVTNSAGYISGGTHSGTAVSVSASELVSGTINITSSGNTDVTNYATASVASGSATASATKGTVSNHSVTVTPSVTRTAGYVTAGTASGTAVTVSASELVSGSETKTANGTYDVTNLASLVVAVPLQHIYTGTSAPSSSLGSNGDVYIQTA